MEPSQTQEESNFYGYMFKIDADKQSSTICF